MEQKHMTLAGATGAIGMVLVLLQQVAATRESFIKAQAYGDAKSDSLKVCRILLKEKTKELKLCQKSHPRHRAKERSPEVVKESTVSKVLRWAAAPGRWLTGG